MSTRISSALRGGLKKAQRTVYLGPHRVGSGCPTYFIAEIGNNHNGDFFLAKRSIEAAAKVGVHAVKFQKRSIPDVFAKELREKPQTKEEIRGKTYGEYREGLELSLEDFLRLKEIAHFNNVAFFATPFDLPSVDFLEEVNVPFYKIASFDVTNLPLLDYIAHKGRPIILSTGMATLDEVDEAITTILKHNNKLVVLHCVSVYPSPDEHINLGALQELKERYGGIPIGYSGHEQDILPTLTAIALGACVVERHFTLSKQLPGPDHGSVSIEPAVFSQLVESAHRIRTLFGTGHKELIEGERTSRDKHSKSIVALVDIPQGTSITASMLTCKSPGHGLKPRELSFVIGKKAATDIGADSVLKKEDVVWEEIGVVSPLQPRRKKSKKPPQNKKKK